MQQVCPAGGTGGTLLVVGWISACWRDTVISAAGPGSLLWICDIMDVSDGRGSRAAGCSHCASQPEHDGLLPVTPCWEFLWCGSCSCVQTFCSLFHLCLWPPNWKCGKISRRNLGASLPCCWGCVAHRALASQRWLQLRAELGHSTAVLSFQRCPGGQLQGW